MYVAGIFLFILILAKWYYYPGQKYSTIRKKTPEIFIKYKHSLRIM